MGTEGHNKGNFTDSKQRKWSAKTKKKKVDSKGGKGKRKRKNTPNRLKDGKYPNSSSCYNR